MERTEKMILLVFTIWCLGCVYVLQNVNLNIPENSVYEMVIMLFVSFLLGFLLRNEMNIPNTLKKTHKSKPESIILSAKDDLKVVEGIGPAIEKILNASGIQTYRELASKSVLELKEILKKAGPIYENHGEETWGEQAALLRDGKVMEFKKLTEELVGGHRIS